jgi:hypothetical protein
MRLAAEVLVIRIGCGNEAAGLLVEAVDLRQLRRVRQRKGAQKYLIDQAEDSGVGANAER